MWQYCAEEAEHCVLKGAIVCSNPFNLEVSSKMLQSSLLGKEVYLRAMGGRFDWFCLCFVSSTISLWC